MLRPKLLAIALLLRRVTDVFGGISNRNVLGACCKRACVALLLLVGPAHTALAQQDPLLVTTDPFVSSTAIDNLRKCVEVSPADAENLARIREFSYKFEPPQGISAGERVRIERHALMSIDNFGRQDLVKAVEALRWGNCETDIKISGISVELTAINRIVVKYHVHADFRDCGSFLGISYKNDVGSSWGDMTVVYVLNQDFEMTIESESISNQGSNANPFYEIVDKLADVLPFVHTYGIVLRQAIKDKLASISTSSGVSNPNSGLSTLVQSKFMALAIGITTVEGFAHNIELLLPPVWSYETVNDQTGIVSLGENSSSFRFVEFDEISGDIGAEAYGFKVAEIKVINELRNPSPRHHTVLEGENLWRIAGRYYRDPKLFAVLERVNGLQGKLIRPGDQIVVPLQTDLCEEVRTGRMVLPGDTVWALQMQHPNYKPKGKHFRSGRLEMIYPYEQINLNQ